MCYKSFPWHVVSHFGYILEGFGIVSPMNKNKNFLKVLTLVK